MRRSFFRAAPPARASRIYYGWLMAATLGITTIVSYGTTQYLAGVLLPPVTRELGWNRATTSGAFALGTVVAGLAGLPVGRALDRYGARWLLTAGSALAGACLILLARVRQPWQFYLLWSVGLGLAMALTFYPVTFTVIAQWFSRRRGAALATLTLLGGLASPIFIPFAGWLFQQVGWRQALVVLGLSQFVVALPLHAVVVRRRPEDLGLAPDGAEWRAAPAGPDTGVALATALWSRPFWSLTVAAALSFFGSAVLQTQQIAYLIGHGIPATSAADVAGVIGLASLPGRVVLNSLSDRLGPRLLLALCLTAQGIGLACLLAGQGAGWLVAYIVIYGVAFGAVSPLRAAVLAETFGRRAYGVIIAAQGVLVALGAGLGPIVAGWLYDTLGDYRLAFAITTLAFFLAGLCVVATPGEIAAARRRALEAAKGPGDESPGYRPLGKSRSNR